MTLRPRCWSGCGFWRSRLRTSTSFLRCEWPGLQAQLYDKLEPQDPPPDGMTPLAQLLEISKRCHDFVARQYEVWNTEIRPALARHGIVVCDSQSLTDSQSEYLDSYFEREVYPVLTPLAIDPAHPFPHLLNKSLNIILRIEPLVPSDAARQPYAVVRVPSVLSRLVQLPDEQDGFERFVLLEDVIGPRLDSLFGGFRVVDRAPFRVTRNSDLTIQETEIKNSLLSTIQETLRQRKWGAAVRLEISEAADEGFLGQLQTAPALDLEDRDVYRVSGPVALERVIGFVPDRWSSRSEGAELRAATAGHASEPVGHFLVDTAA